MSDRMRVVGPHDGPYVTFGGRGIHFKISGAETEGRICVVEHPVEPGRLIAPHVHKNEDELTYVLEGEIGVKVGDQETSLQAGSYVWKPRNLPHTYWNASSKPCRIMEMIVPGNFGSFFEELCQLPRDDRGRIDPALTNELAGRYGLEFLVEQLAPALKQKYNLKLVGE